MNKTPLLKSTPRSAGNLLAATLILKGLAPALFAASITWEGYVNNSWDTTSANWTNNSGSAVIYNNVTPDAPTFADGALLTNLTIPADVAPGNVFFTNSLQAYSLAGNGRITGTASLTKSGTNGLTLNNSSPYTYTGGTYLKSGSLVIGANNALPIGLPLYLSDSNVSSGAVTLNLTTQSLAVGGLTNFGAPFASTAVPTNQIIIGPGQSLTVTNNFMVGFNQVISSYYDVVDISGPGSLIVSNSSMIRVGGADLANSTCACKTTFDLSGLAAASINLGTNGNFWFSDWSPSGDSVGNRQYNTTILASNTVITAGNLLSASNRVSDYSMFEFGAGSNILNISTIQTPWQLQGKSEVGRFYFWTNTGSLMVRDSSGTNRAQILLWANTNTAANNSTAASAQPAIMDFGSHWADLYLSLLKVGENQSFSASASGVQSNYFGFANGILNTTALRLGNRTGASSAAANSQFIAVCNLGNSATTNATVIIGTNGITMGTSYANASSYNLTTTALLTFGGGTVTVNGPVQLANQEAPSATGCPLVSTLAITGGIVTMNSNIFCLNTNNSPAQRTATLSLLGGSLDMRGNAIGGTNLLANNTNNYVDVLDFEAGTLQNVGQINGGAGILLMSGTNTLVLAGTNSYTSPTVVSNGTLLVNGISGTNTVTVMANATLGGSGVIPAQVTVQSGGTLVVGNPATPALGVLTLSNNFTMGGTVVMRINKSVSPSNDVLKVSGTLTYGGALVVTNLGGALATGDSFTLFQAGAAGGSLPAVTLPTLTGGLSWDLSQLLSAGKIMVAANGLAPAITNWVASLTRQCSQDTTFTVQANGSAPLYYQWSVDGSPVGTDSSSFTMLWSSYPDPVGTPHTLSVTITNSLGQVTSNATVTVIDTIPPVVVVNGPNPMTIPLNSTFNDPGASAYDSCDGSLGSTEISNTVNPGVLGTYYVVYQATDSHGNSGQATLTVIVNDNAIWVSPYSDYWSNSGNWTNDFSPDGSAYIGNFATIDLTSDITVSLDTPKTMGGLVFADLTPSTPANWIIDNYDPNMGGYNPENTLTLAPTNGVVTPAITVNELGTTNEVIMNTIIAGSHGLAKNGVGILALADDNSYTGGTIVNQGTLQIGNGAAQGSIIGNVTNNGILAFARTDAATFDVSISGLGSLEILGGGSVTLTNDCTYAGNTFVRNGGLVAGTNSVLPAGTSIVLGNTNSYTAGTVGSLSVDNQTISNLTAISLDATATNVVTIATGDTLQVDGNTALGYNTIQFDNAGTNEVMFTGGGSLMETSPGGTFVVAEGAAGNVSRTAPFATADMSGLGSATLNLGTNGSVVMGLNQAGGVGNGGNYWLLPTNTMIEANLFSMGGGQYQVYLGDYLVLGDGATVFNVNTNYVGAPVGRQWGQITFGSPSGTLRMRAADGVSPAAFYLGTGQSTVYGTNTYDLVDLRGHSADLLLSTLTIGNETKATAVQYEFDFDTGILNAIGMNVGTKPATAANNVALSTVNLLGGTVVVGASGITCAGSNGTGVETDSTNIVQLNFGGASVTVSNDIVLGTQTSTAGNATLLSTLNITGGTVTVDGDILCGLSGVPVNPAPRLATLALNGPDALLDLKGHTIGGTAGNVTNYLDALNFEQGTLQNVGGINGGAPLVKIGAGLLTLAGSSTYTGGTVVSNGTLVVNADGALGTGPVTVTPGTALTLTNGVSNQYINPQAALYLISGASPVNLGFNASSPNHIAGLYFDGVAQAAGSYGSTSSTATHADNVHFAGTGVLVVTVPVASVTLTTSPNPSLAGQTVVFTATVTGTSGTPTGTVAFLNGANVVGSAVVNDSGIASITNSTLPAGTDSLTAAYGGSLTYTPATSSAVAQTVNFLPPHIGPVSLNGTNVMVQLGSTAVGTSYVLQAATNLVAPIIWLPVQTNAGTGSTITNLVPVNLGLPMEFFRYQLQ